MDKGKKTTSNDWIEEFCKEGINYMEDLPKLAQTYRGKRVTLKSPEDVVVRITELDGTIYMGRKHMYEAWEHLYLPEPRKMVLIGAIDDTYHFEEDIQLIVLVDSLGNVYFYESEVLHHVACSVKDFFTKGARYPPMRSYRYGEYCSRIEDATPEYNQAETESFFLHDHEVLLPLPGN
ncbi:hypothetical protein MATL_G00218760 [Megalops atlanticus]|uniref:Uncharacterized protein n=1 Tax=Megalops atlanticus TaxID=7932 RepID=A0A9D3PH69_MEGAT|nr:hypothetical protein MATL_G00218760 [Megalops atlanticus]